MFKTKPLSRAAGYSKRKVDKAGVSLDNFITTDNLLPGKTGIGSAVNLPPHEGAMPGYDKGNILVSNIRPYLKKIWLANRSGGCSADVLVFDVNGDHHPEFVYYTMFQDIFFDHMMRGSKGTKMPRGDKTQVMDFKIPDIDIGNQKKIAAVLSALDAKIELNNRINAELEAMAKTLYDYWFVQFDFPDVNGLPYKSSGGKMTYNPTLKRDIPKGWTAKPLKKITGVSNESLSPELKPDIVFKHYSIPVYDDKKTYGLEYGSEIHSNKYLVTENDVLVSKLNPQFSRIIYPIAEENLICSTEFVVWRAESQILKSYLYQIAKSDHFRVYCIQSAAGTSHSHKRVNPTVMMRYQVPYDEVICRKFGGGVKPLIHKAAMNLAETQHLTSLRDFLLPMLMNGQVQVG
ncbi:MAG: restriction endonuclease subunit S [Opitutae bacterium]|nr:restriction endonuclease subunit S [Opitutae bacterium]